MTEHDLKKESKSETGREASVVERLVMWLTPPTREGFAFTDSVSGESVWYYRDAFGKRWMKNSKFGIFKVEANE